MELFDYLSNKDKTTITTWIEGNRSYVIPDLSKTLRYWNKNKRTMFKLLGKNLSVKIPIEVKLNKTLYYQFINEIYCTPDIFVDIAEVRFNPSTIKNEFVEDLFLYCVNKYYDEIIKQKEESPNFFHYEVVGKRVSSAAPECYKDTPTGPSLYNFMKILVNLFSHYTLGNGYLAYTYTIWLPNKKKLRLVKGTKIMRAIQKVLQYIDYPNLILFENWRNQLSNLSTVSNIKANLVLSINPIDFLTLSDNNCGWTSCVGFAKRGEFSVALTEMMNSNCTIVAYLESLHRKFTFNYCDIPNKSWRQIFYCHKDIICAGKAYPYNSDELTQTVLSEIQKLAKANLNWDYMFGPQLYRDMNYTDNIFIRRHIPREKGYKIYFHTLGYYNDFSADRTYNYWCIRNKVKKDTLISISGPATCLICGDKLIEQPSKWLAQYNSDEIVNDYYNTYICDKCHQYDCRCCDRTDLTKKMYKLPSACGWNGYLYICKDCLKEMAVFKNNKHFYSIAENSPYVFYFKNLYHDMPNSVKENLLTGEEVDYEQYRFISDSNSF